MKKSVLVSILFCMGFVACSEKPALKIYRDASNMYKLEIENTRQNDSDIADSLFIFHDMKNEKLVVKTGFFRHGFRNGKWLYNNVNQMDTIVWSHYKDKYLGFETSLFEYTDTVLHGDYASEFVFYRNNNRISLDISLNGPAKDAFSGNDYSVFREKALLQLNESGMMLVSFDSIKLSNKENDIMVFTIKAKDKLTGEESISKTAFGPLDTSHFIGISTGSVAKNEFYLTELFNGVLTTLSIDGKQLYIPIKKD